MFALIAIYSMLAAPIISLEFSNATPISSNVSCYNVNVKKEISEVSEINDPKLIKKVLIKDKCQYRFSDFINFNCEDHGADKEDKGQLDIDPHVNTKQWSLILNNFESYSQAPNLAKLVPVTVTSDKQNSSTTYRNIYCAICNDERIVNEWTEKFSEKMQEEQESDNEKPSPISYSDLKFTSNSMLFSTSEKFWSFRIFCSSDFLTRYSSMKHKNKYKLAKMFTAFCSEIPPQVFPDQIRIDRNLKECPSSGLRDRNRRNAAIDFKQFKPPKLSILVNFHPDGTSKIVYTDSDGEVVKLTQEQCNPGEVFDIFSQSCRGLFCPKNYYLTTKGCVPEENGKEELVATFTTKTTMQVGIDQKWTFPVLNFLILFLENNFDFNFRVVGNSTENNAINVKTPEIYDTTLSETTTQKMEEEAPNAPEEDRYITNTITLKMYHYTDDDLDFFTNDNFNITKIAESCLKIWTWGAKKIVSIEKVETAVKFNPNSEFFMNECQEESSTSVITIPNYLYNLEPVWFPYKSEPDLFQTNKFTQLKLRTNINSKGSNNSKSNYKQPSNYSNNIFSSGEFKLTDIIWRIYSNEESTTKFGMSINSDAGICIKQRSIDCMYIELSADEVSIDYDTKVMTYNGTNGQIIEIPDEGWYYPTHDYSNFDVDGYHYHVCLSYLIEVDSDGGRYEQTTYDKVLNWATFIFSILSMISLCISIFMYTHDPVLKNNRNNNVRNLCTAILINLIIFVFLINVKDPSYLCFIRLDYFGEPFLHKGRIFWKQKGAFRDFAP